MLGGDGGKDQVKKKKKKKKKPVDLAKGTKHLWSATGIKQQLDTIPL